MVNWNANIDALLFKNVLKMIEFKPRYEELEKAMRADGIDVTAKAIQHRFGKIRNTVNIENPHVKLGPPQKKPRDSTHLGLKRNDKLVLKKVVEDGDFFDAPKQEPEPEQGPSEDVEAPKKRKRAAPKKPIQPRKAKKVVKTEASDDSEHEDSDTMEDRI